MPDCDVTGKRLEPLLVERFCDLAHRARDVGFLSVGGGNARTLLSPVLKRVEAEVGEIGRLRVPENAEDAAFVLIGHG